jgi:competence protein CoiA
MLYADGASGKKVVASPGALGRCPGCGEELIPKCGSLISWHWAHQAREDCDPWWEPECAWHLEWKGLVDPQYCEVVMGEHRADICSSTGLVVELQHSALSPEDVLAREAFYRDRLIWMYDASAFVRNVQFRDRGNYYSFRWRWPRRSMWCVTRPMYWDMGDNEVFYVRKIHHHTPCGGWGTPISKTTFLERFLYRALTDKTKDQMDLGEYNPHPQSAWKSQA